MRVLALDFDGVISDSAPEAFLVALLTYRDLEPAGRLVPPPALARDGPLPTPAAILSEPLFAAFAALMPLGNRAEDFGAALRALDAGAELREQSAYDAFRAGLPEPWLAAYHRRFYERREELSSRDPGGWRGLMGPYPAFLELLRRRRADATLAIATAKDRASVDALLGAYGIADLFAPGCVLDKETGVSKRAHLRELQRRCGVPYPEITFVDDKVNHLDGVAPLGVRCALAAWGYNGPREHSLARARGHLVCELGDAEAKLFDGS